MGDGNQRCNDAAKQFVFGMMMQAGMDVYAAGCCDTTVDGIIRVLAKKDGTNEDEYRYFDVLVRSAETWTGFPIPVQEMVTDRSILIALNWTTREVFWVPGVALRHPDADTRRDFPQGLLNKLSRPHMEKAGATDLKKLAHFVTE